METLVEPFKSILEALGFCKLIQYAGFFALIFYGLAIYIGKIIVSSIHKYFKKRKEFKNAQDLHTIFDETDVFDKTEIYVKPYFQLSSPTINSYAGSNNSGRIFAIEDPNDLLDVTVASTKRRKLLPFIIYDIFKTPRPFWARLLNPFRLISRRVGPGYELKGLSSNNFFFILGDTGIGKTAFMINLYLTYNKKWNKKYNVKLFPLTIDDVEIKIRDVSDKKNTILLLDALDEDQRAGNNVSGRIAELLDLSKDFRKVLFTCRTQFFSDEKDEPDETLLKKHGGIGVHRFGRIYLSNFTDQDVKSFINLKYKDNPELLSRAVTISKQIPDVCIRPMILKYFDDFLDGKRSLTYKNDIYTLIVEKWVEREKYNLPVNKRGNFKDNLLNFSKDIAMHIYKTADPSLSIHSLEIDKFAEEHHITLTAMELKSRSLLHRGEQDFYKFAHKSILEYFLADHLYSDYKFLCQFNATAFDAAMSFYKERCIKLHTIPFLRSLTDKNLDRLTVEDRLEVIDILRNRLEINKRTLEVIIWRAESKDPYRFDFTLLGEILQITLTDETFDEKIILGLRGLRQLKLLACKRRNLEFLKFTQISKDDVQLINAI